MEGYSDYIIIQAANVDELTKEVKKYLKDGWIVLGAPFFHSVEGGSEFCQALIKKEMTKPGSIGFNR